MELKMVENACSILPALLLSAEVTGTQHYTEYHYLSLSLCVRGESLHLYNERTRSRMAWKQQKFLKVVKAEISKMMCIFRRFDS